MNKTKAGVQGSIEGRFLAVLRANLGAEVSYAAPPRRLTGGFWAELFAFRLDGAPSGWDGELVARVMPDAGTAAKESAVQREVAAQGFQTPAVHLVGGPGDGLGQAFMVMDLAAGAPLLAGLDGAAALVALPRIARQLPVTLGSTMARLHQIDAAPVRAALERVAPAEDYSVGRYLARLHEQVDALGRADLVAAARWLEDNPPPATPDVVCHGDLHPFNLLRGTDGDVTVLDWSASLLGAAAYDVAFTSLLVAEPPLDAPRALLPVVRAAGRMLSKRFVRAYGRALGRPVDSVSLRWHQGLVCLRVMTDVASWSAAGELESRAGHPWLSSGPALARRLTALCGVAIAPR